MYIIAATVHLLTPVGQIASRPARSTTAMLSWTVWFDS